ncbi:hypothetical protein BGX38DRAFT_1074071, partial [Terfezia claveryi]
FTALTHLSLANLRLPPGELDFIRLLPKLASLDLTNTGVNSNALYALVALHRTLRTLKLTKNPNVDDGALIPLCSLTALTTLYLEETRFTMAGLRTLVNEFKAGFALPTPRSKQKLQIPTVPYPCMWYFVSHPQYAKDIPAGPGYVKDPAAVARLGVETLLKNLKVHNQINKWISLGGSKMEMAGRLREYLWRRKMD